MDQTSLPETGPAGRAPLARAVFLACGFVCVAIGFVGIFVPLLPTVPFLILAAACFSRSSRRLETWLLAHPRLGPPLLAWRERGAIPRRAKVLAVAGMASGFAAFVAFARPGWPLALGAVALIGMGLAYVLSRPDA